MADSSLRSGEFMTIRFKLQGNKQDKSSPEDEGENGEMNGDSSSTQARKTSKGRKGSPRKGSKDSKSSPGHESASRSGEVSRDPNVNEIGETIIEIKDYERESPRKIAAQSKTSQSENVEVNEKMEVKTVSPSHKTPVKMQQNNGVMEPVTPLNVQDFNTRLAADPKATSTPAANGMIMNDSQSPPLSPGSTTDPSDDEDDDRSQDEFHHRRSPSPTSSFSSVSTSSSMRRQHAEVVCNKRNVDMNFGQFYNQSYLMAGKQNYMKRAAQNPSLGKSPQYHRPENFSYNKETPQFLKPKKGGGMMALAGGGQHVVKVRRSSSPADLKNDEAIRLSMFPSARPLKPNEISKIEREDWPGPPSPAAILPEIMRQRRKSRGEESDEEVEVQIDPKIIRELEQMDKIKDKSGIGKVIYRELEELKTIPPPPLDPWKASRAPGADHEPSFQTRFQSPMFASPSRFLDRKRRAWDDSDIRGYRSMVRYNNYPMPKPGYGSYGLSPKAATLPVSGYYGGPLDFRFFDYDESEDASKLQKSSHTSTSTVNTETRETRSRGSSIFDGPGVSLMTFQRNTWHDLDAKPPTYPYERLTITTFDLPKDVDRNQLEVHLDDDDFDHLFKMSKEEFSRLAEWKRNDLKRRHDLY